MCSITENKKVQRLINEAISKGFRTGSHEFGLSLPDSDIDYVLLASDYPSGLGKYSKAHDDIDDRGYDIDLPALYVTHDGNLYNFIRVETPTDYEAWKYATDMLMALPRSYIENKQTRVTLFQECRESYLIKHCGIKDVR